MMTDRHLRILGLMAQQRQQALRNYDAADHTGDAASTGRREYLAGAATRTRTRVEDAEQRRNPRPSGHRATPAAAQFGLSAAAPITTSGRKARP